jgi:uncharacterized LabA/DUF88 family protein
VGVITQISAKQVKMSMSENIEGNPKGEERGNQKAAEESAPIRVYGFVDGFNLYHALQKFDPAVSVPDPDRYQKYKWLCLTSLIKRFISPRTETLVGVELFTAYPNWQNAGAKKVRHQTFVSSQEEMGVHVTLGEFKPKTVTCLSTCRQPFQTYVEKQTDINIAVSLISFADRYDKAILLTADSDQVPTINLLKGMYPKKRFAVLPPIGRGAKDLQKVCHESFKMTEAHLSACQLLNPLPVVREGKTIGYLVKPTVWP